jgi:hypothetical protein
LVPKIKNIYGDSIKCGDDYCSFTTPCKEVTLKNTTIQFNFGSEIGLNPGIDISLYLERYLVDGAKLGYKDRRCFLPIFTFNARSDTFRYEQNLWYLGNMFLDKYYVINDNHIRLLDILKPPRIGIMKKEFYEDYIS